MNDMKLTTDSAMATVESLAVHDRVELVTLRDALPGTRAEQDAALVQLQAQGRIVLMKDDAINMRSKSVQDRAEAAAIRFGDFSNVGHSRWDGQRHLVIIDRRGIKRFEAGRTK